MHLRINHTQISDKRQAGTLFIYNTLTDLCLTENIHFRDEKCLAELTDRLSGDYCDLGQWPTFAISISLFV